MNSAPRVTNDNAPEHELATKEGLAYAMIELRLRRILLFVCSSYVELSSPSSQV